MKNLKEKQFLVNMALSLGQTPDPALVKELEEHKKIMDTVTPMGEEFGSLMAQLKQLKDEVDTIKTTVEIKQQYFPEAPKEFPKPPTLDELMASLPVEEVVEKVIEKPTAEVEETNPLIKLASEHITKESKIEEDSYQQPDTPLVKSLDDIRKKIKFLEGWISKISMAGPGGGEVNLLKLDDVDTSAIGDGKVLAYSAANAKIEFRTSAGGTGAVDSVNGLTGTVVLSSANISEDTNFYFTNARVVAALTAGQNITLDANGRINSTATGGTEADTLATVTNRGNVTTNGITINNANADFFAVNTAANFTVTTGQIAWNPADLTFDMGMANGVTLQVGQEQYIKVKAGSAISDGQAVMFAGASGEHIIAVPNDVSVPGYIPEWFIGIATQDLAHNAFGYITVFGKVHNVNTLAYTAGDILYADPLTVGGLTNTEPAAPYPHIVVAAVTKRAGGDGHILVRPTLRFKISQLSDTNITSPSSGQVLTYQGNVWFNRNINSANVTELTNLYYTNARVYSNVISLNYITSSALSGYATNTQLASYATNSQLASYATTSYVGNALADLVASAPASLDTLNELAAALGNDNNFSTTVLTYIGTKANTVSLTTANVSELTNLYFTNTRTRQAISVVGAGSYDNTTGIITITSSSSYSDANTYSNVTLLGYITSSALSGYATNSQLSLYATNTQLASYALTTSLTTANVSELNNLYFSNDRVYSNVTQLGYITNNALIGYATNSQLALYATNTNVNLKANIVDLTTANVAELTNLYYTNARVYANVISLNYINSSALSGYATNSQLSLFATTNNSLSQFASTTSAQLATLISDETGTGSLVFAASPVLSGTVSIGGTANIMLSVSNTTSQIKVSPASGASNANSKISLFGTFFNFPADTGPRLIATVKSGFSTGIWGTEYLDILVNNGAANDASTEANQNRVARFTKGNVDITGNIVVTGLSRLGTVTSGPINGSNISTIRALAILGWLNS